MPFPPRPYAISCKQCHWSKTFAPTSDVLTPDECPQNCPDCNSLQLEYKH